MASTLLIVSDIGLYREGLVRVLRDDGRFDVVGASARHDDALRCVAELSPHVVLLDMAMPDCFLTLRELVEAPRRPIVVVLTVPEVESAVVSLAEAGVAGYVTRQGTLEDLVRTIEAAVRGELRCSARVAGSLLRRVAALAVSNQVNDATASLTQRESEVLSLIEGGKTNKEIACELGIEVATAKNHVHNILEKLHVRRRDEAARLLRRRRIQGSMIGLTTKTP